MSEWLGVVAGIALATVIVGATLAFLHLSETAYEMGTWRWWTWGAIARRQRIQALEHDLGYVCADPRCIPCGWKIRSER